jgi:hypothetical protein
MSQLSRRQRPWAIGIALLGATVITSAALAGASTAATSLQFASGSGVTQVSLDGGSNWTTAFATDSSGPWPAPFSGSNWNTPSANRNQTYGDPQDIYYRIRFTLTTVAKDQALTGRIAADDQPVAVLLNGTTIASFTETSGAYDPSPHPFSTHSAKLFRTGANTLEFHTLNLGGPTGVDFSGRVTPGAAGKSVTSTTPKTTTSTSTPATTQATGGARHPLWRWIVIEQDRYTTPLPGPLELTLATEPILEWPATDPVFLPNLHAPSQARLEVEITGPPSGSNIRISADRTCSNATDPYATTTSTTTQNYALTAKPNHETTLPEAVQKLHTGVACSWVLHVAVPYARPATITVEAIGLQIGRVVQVFSAIGGVTYDPETCSITVRSGSDQRSCTPVTGS